jgi:branched-chain amino acid transport system substrate-binding protein
MKLFCLASRTPAGSDRVRSDKRRTLIAGCSLAAGLLLAAPVAIAQSTPLKVGLVLAKQGFAAELGGATAQGAQLALTQFPPKAPIELVWYDEPNPQAAQQNFIKLVEQDKVVAVIGGTTSGTALAMAAAAKQTKTPLIVPGATAREVTGKDCNRYTFRIAPPVPTAATALAPVMLEYGKDWYFLVASYAYGEDVYKSMERELKKAGGRSVGHDIVPGGTSDFSSYILKIRRAKPSIVVLGVGGSDINAFIKQYVEFGMEKSVPVIAPFVSDGQLWALGEKANGLFGKAWHYSDPANSQPEKDFVKAYEKKFNQPPLVEAWQGWTAMRMLLASLDKAKATDSKSVVGALESVKVPNDALPLAFRAWDHQLVRPMLVVRGKAPPAGDKWNAIEVVRRVPAKASDLDAVFGSQAEVGCTLGDS